MLNQRGKHIDNLINDTQPMSWQGGGIPTFLQLWP
jgi:hypothetical protein